MLNFATIACVLAVGDSITFGIGAGVGRDWPSLLRDTGVEVRNVGRAGGTSADAVSDEDGGHWRATIEPNLDCNDLVIYMEGSNDAQFYPQPSGARYEANVLEFIRRVAPSPVFLLAPPPNLLNGEPKIANIYLDEYRKVLRSIARRLPRVTYIDATRELTDPLAFECNVLGCPGIHPSAFGHELIFEKIMRKLRRLDGR